MSRDVRRVPLDYKHPTEFNPYWREHERSFMGLPKPLSRLRGRRERFVGLMDGYAESLAEWEQKKADLANREGHSWKFGIEYHLTGYQSHGDSKPVVRPFYLFEGENEEVVTVRDEDHLHELMTTQHEHEKPNPEHYMPVFDVPASDLGWVLYETVSEGTPVTPIFKTAEELVDHLATVGQDWDQVPMRRASAEAIVGQGGTIGSFIGMNGQLFDSTKDADKIQNLGKDNA